VKERILDLFRQNPGRTFSIREILKHLGLPLSERASLRRRLRELASEGHVRLLRNRHYGSTRPQKTIVGTLSVTHRGVGFVSPEGETPRVGEEAPSDVMISRRNMGSAIHGDRVEVHVVREQFGRREGYVVKVLERRSPMLVGRFLRQRRGGLVLPRDPRIDRNILVAQPPPRNVVKDDQWVVVKITRWTEWPEPLYGRIEEVLGSDGDPGLDVLLIVRDHGIVPEFPEEVEREAASLRSRLSREDIARRRDLRHLPVVTIDPERAKDFDDAVSLEITKSGNYNLGVHIADVAHYVAEGSAIDREALDRATSIYPVDRVVPMLPERVSNDLCSLRPRRDRPAMSVMMEITPKGRVVRYEIFRSVIRSRHRLTYRQVQDLFDGVESKTGAFADAHEMLFLMRDLAAVLAARRRRLGCLDLDIPETEVILDSAGRVRDVRRSERWESHRLIEQFMILANEVVARHLTDLGLPLIYRVHEPPDPAKLERLRPFFAAVGVRVPETDGPISQRTLQRLLDRLSEKEAGSVLHTLVLRAMMRAVYSPRNVGHYGLASPCYCHFTSPIRRYPDLVVHRVLAAWLERGAIAPRQIETWRERFDDIARHSSEREERADEVERDTVKVKSLEFMRGFIGEEFEGVISGVVSFGFFVELKTYPVEGLVRVRDLADDYYHFDEETLSLVGEASGKRYRFGDKVTVVVTRVDLINLEMDLVPSETAARAESAAKRPRARRRRPRAAVRRKR